MWDRIQGTWKRCSGSLRVQWGMFICDNSMVFRGKRDQLVGSIQERYGIVGKDIEAQADEFARSLILGDFDLAADLSSAHREQARRGDKSRETFSVFAANNKKAGSHIDPPLSQEHPEKVGGLS